MMIGERLNELRKDKGLTQKQLAEILCINFRTYSGYERGETEASDDIKIKIAKYFNISIDYLLGITENPHPITSSSEYIRLPNRFTTESRKDLQKYIEFLVQRDKENKKL